MHRQKGFPMSKNITIRAQYDMAQEWAVLNGYASADHAFAILGLHEALRLMNLPSFKTAEDVLLLGGQVPVWARQYQLHALAILIREAEGRLKEAEGRIERLKYEHRQMLDWQPA